MPNIIVAPVHFEDFSGEAFERLVFAYHLRAEWWHQLDWYGQTGSDSGRDIWCSRENDYTLLETLCIQCVNREKFTRAKAFEDVTKILNGPKGAPNRIRFVCRSNVSAKLRDDLRSYGDANAIDNLEIWSGQEFEERLRFYAEALLLRFCKGESFPDACKDLGDFVRELPAINDDEIIARLSGIFERPAFTTPFHAESSLGDFKTAISASIEAINTGICRANDGTVFRKIHSRHEVQDASKKKDLERIAESLNRLRIEYDTLERTGEIELCGSGNHFHLSSYAVKTMDGTRREILDMFRRLCPRFSALLQGGVK